MYVYLHAKYTHAYDIYMDLSDKTYYWHVHALVCIGSNWYRVHLLTLLELKQPENIRLATDAKNRPLNWPI